MLIVLIIPILYYLFTGWKLRRNEIVTSFTGDGILRYYETFFQRKHKEIVELLEITDEQITKQTKKDINNPESDDEDVRLTKEQNSKLIEKFDDYYDLTFGKKRFIVPVLFLILVILATTFLILFLAFNNKILELFYKSENYEKLVITALAGFLGSYMWILQFLINRIQGRQLSPLDIYWASFRVIISIPVSLAITTIIEDPLKYCIAFILGAFPTTTLFKMMRVLFSSKVGFKEETDQTSVLLNLQGIGRKQAEKFSEEGVETILQLAYSDPVDLTIRSGYSFSYVVDCCSQALAWLYFENSMETLRKYGIRGAQEIITLNNELNRKASDDPETQDEEEILAKIALNKMAAELKMNKDALQRTFDNIAYDPYAQLLNDIWHSEWN